MSEYICLELDSHLYEYVHYIYCQFSIIYSFIRGILKEKNNKQKKSFLKELG